jgi:hypothetical protein
LKTIWDQDENRNSNSVTDSICSHGNSIGWLCSKIVVQFHEPRVNSKSKISRSGVLERNFSRRSTLYPRYSSILVKS